MADKTDRFKWQDEDTYWRGNFRSRPYASSAGRDYEFYQPGYRYGVEAANRFEGRSWDQVEPELSKNWSSYQHRGDSTWEHIKGAVRDAWDRLTGKPVGTH